MRAISVRQPFAERIASGKKRIEYRTWRVAPGPILVVASVARHAVADAREVEGLPMGVMVCVVDVVKVTGERGAYEWHLRDPRRVRPEPVRGWAAIYHVADGLIVQISGGAPQPRSSKRRSRAAR